MNQQDYFKRYLVRKCLDCESFPQIKLCHKHINVYCSEFYICEKCFKDTGKEVSGSHRYDSLVLCDEHNKPMGDIMTKLLEAIYSVPDKVTTIRSLGL